MSLTLKLLFRDEVRRISLPRATLTYNLLRQEVSNTLLLSNFSLKYLDEEGDQISLCSNIELLEAVRQLDEKKEKLLKIYVNEEKLNLVLPTPPKQKTSIPVTEPIKNQPQRKATSFPTLDELTHKNIFCSSCKIEIVGVRWKCSICPLNLCELCEPWDNHNSSHPLLRMKQPISPALNCAYMTISNFHQFGEQINRYLSSPQVAEISTNAIKIGEKIGEEVAGKIKSVADEVFEQTKEIRQEISSVITKETNNFVGMCSKLNEELSKTCRYSSQPKQQNPRPQPSKPVSVPKYTELPKPRVVPEPVPAPAPVPVPTPIEYAWELDVLHQMGFVDDIKNAALLKQFRGDLNECLNSLFTN
eukprot:TRINITY_DN15493_c0_g1_i1.p1 TRINITY_DN15493_c0_g1~~TRINITY_DN15493_c0_g1_i1.p1  ORF type:complete len:360 (+),score=80.71 TRINITY_DN15493_c0_g1_i1:126-1205(+)